MLTSAGDSVMSLETDMRPGDIKMWSNGEVEESPEDMETPVPVSFGPVLAFMETSYEEAKTEYYGLLEGHVGELLSGCVEFNEVLRSNLALEIVSCLKSGLGYKGFHPWNCKLKKTFRLSIRSVPDLSTPGSTNMPRKSLTG